MIHLDTNVLVGLMNEQAPLGPLLNRLRNADEPATSALAWHEFYCGPVTPGHLEIARRLIGPRIVALDAAVAELGAVLFNATGRRRSSRSDCLIAATAMTYDALLFTLDAADFERFEPLGLRLLR